MADRDGRLEDRPKRIRAEVLPYDDGNVDSLLSELHQAGFILRYPCGVTGSLGVSFATIPPKISAHLSAHWATPYSPRLWLPGSLVEVAPQVAGCDHKKELRPGPGKAGSGALPEPRYGVQADAPPQPGEIDNQRWCVT